MSVKVDQALISHFIESDFDLSIAHENQIFTPVSGTPYVEIMVLQNDVTPYSLKHSDETDGLFRAIVRYPLDVGSITPKAKADEILAAFKIGTRVVYEGVTVTIVSQQRDQAVPVDGWYSLSLTFAYRAFLSR